MTPTEYLEGILKEQSLADDSSEIKDLRKRRSDVEGLLKEEFNESAPTIQYGGSYAKKTMIKEHYDLDIISYFAHDADSAGETLKEIYDNVASALDEKYYIDKKKSAIRLRGKDDDVFKVDFHIDVVPGRYTDDKRQDVFIYQHGAEKERLKTDLKKHISHIRDSGLTDAIKLLKLWNTRRSLGVKTFILELMVVKLLSDDKSKSLEKQLTKFWDKIVDAKGNVVVEDPANPSGNDLSEFNDSHQQSVLESNARNTLNTIENDGWEAIFGKLSEEEDKSAAYSGIAVQTSQLTKPWARQGK